MTAKKVLIVDDSRSICLFLTKVLSADPELEVVGHALDPFEARGMIKELRPDVLTLDVEMPRMNGLTFLRNLMRLHPIPVVMVSSLTAPGAAITLDALEAGAIDFMVKRHAHSEESMEAYCGEIVRRVKNAARTRIRSKKISCAGVSTKEVENLPDLAPLLKRYRGDKAVSPKLKRLVAMGASTGGPEALRQVLTEFYAPDCAVVLCQHMPERFMETFAERLNLHSRFNIALAIDGEEVKPGFGYVAPGDKHLEIVNKAGTLFCKVTDGPQVSGHRPSVDVLFTSIATQLKKGVIGVLLTGMGEDGAKGLTLLHDNGSPTIVQDEASSAVWGMPGRAYELGGADQAIGLDSVGPALNAVSKRAA